MYGVRMKANGDPIKSIQTNALTRIVDDIDEVLEQSPYPSLYSNMPEATLNAVRAMLAKKYGVPSRTLTLRGFFKHAEKTAAEAEWEAFTERARAADPDDLPAMMEDAQQLQNRLTHATPEERAGFERVVEGGVLLRTAGDLRKPDGTSYDPDEKYASARTYLFPDGALVFHRSTGGKSEFELLFPDGDAAWMARVDLIRELYEDKPDKLAVAQAAARRVYVLVQTRNGLEVQELGTVPTRFVPENYEPSVRDDFELIATELKTATPTGRLAIVEGPPGSGKSFFIKGLIESVEGAIFVLLPAALTAQLGDPGLLPALMGLKSGSDLPIVLILEDADAALAKRLADNMSMVSALLNFTDGIYGEMLDIRVVASSNTKKFEIDEALVRDGRLICHTHVGQPDRSTREAILRRITKNPEAELPADAQSLASVYRAARRMGWKADVKEPGRLIPGHNQGRQRGSGTLGFQGSANRTENGRVEGSYMLRGARQGTMQPVEVVHVEPRVDGDTVSKTMYRDGEEAVPTSVVVAADAGDYGVREDEYKTHRAAQRGDAGVHSLPAVQQDGLARRGDLASSTDDLGIEGAGPPREASGQAKGLGDVQLASRRD